MQAYKELLATKLRETEGRQTYSATEVRDSYLDLWLALRADFPEVEEQGVELAGVG